MHFIYRVGHENLMHKSHDLKSPPLPVALVMDKGNEISSFLEKSDFFQQLSTLSNFFWEKLEC